MSLVLSVYRIWRPMIVRGDSDLESKRSPDILQGDSGGWTLDTSSLGTQGFESIRGSLAPHLALSLDDAIVASGDSLKLLSEVPDKSVSLILTDPPYHSTQKANIRGDRSFEEDEHFIEWMEQYFREWKRILKLSGTVYMFCSSEMSARLEVMASQYLRPINHVVWTKPNDPGYDGWKGKMRKESLRRWYPHSERILVFEHGTYGSLEAYRRSPMGEYLLASRKKSGLTMIELTELTGEYGRVNRGGAVANWEAGRNIPSREQYVKIVHALEETGKVRMISYEELIRPMRIRSDIEFTDVWDFRSVQPFAGKHPAEKPIDMLRHAIEASSYPGDVVLDCFAGSGSTGVSALLAGRRAVCIEVESNWVERATSEIKHAICQKGDEYYPPERHHHMKGRKRVKSASPLATEPLFD